MCARCQKQSSNIISNTLFQLVFTKILQQLFYRKETKTQIRKSTKSNLHSKCQSWDSKSQRSLLKLTSF